MVDERVVGVVVVVVEGEEVGVVVVVVVDQVGGRYPVEENSWFHTRKTKHGPNTREQKRKETKKSFVLQLLLRVVFFISILCLIFLIK